MAEDPKTPQHLRLGALKQLVALTTAARSSGPAVLMPRRDYG